VDGRAEELEPRLSFVCASPSCNIAVAGSVRFAHSTEARRLGRARLVEAGEEVELVWEP
jgi:hypothetical protein